MSGVSANILPSAFATLLTRTHKTRIRPYKKWEPHINAHIPNTGKALSAKAAASLIRLGEAPDDMVLDEALEIRDNTARLPPGLTAPHILIASNSLEALPDRLKARRIKVRGEKLNKVGSKINCDVLDLQGTPIVSLPSDLSVRQRLDLTGCTRLKALPENLHVGSLILTDCVSLQDLPKGLNVAFLDLSGCSALRKLPDDLSIKGGHLSLRDCPWITQLPDNLGSVSSLDVSGCLNLARLPQGLQITSWIDFAGSAITELPSAYDDVGLRWHGIPVSRKIVFEPETLTAQEILGEQNAELRRVMMERFGYERLFEVANAVEIDKDHDAGGERRLLRIPLENDEDLVCVAVQWPLNRSQVCFACPATYADLQASRCLDRGLR